MKVTYKGEILERTPIKLSNGAQNTVFMPEGAKATKVTFFSVTGTNSSDRTSWWKEVAGVTYTEDTAPATIDLEATRDNPNAITYTLNNVPDKFTFTNTGEQQCVILYIEYHFGGTDGIATVNEGATPLRIEYLTLSGKRVEAPTQGIYLIRMVMANGQTVTKKVMYY